MINLYLPDFYYLFPINMAILDYQRTRPEVFRPLDFKIGAIYGCFPNQAWNGGRAMTGISADVDNIVNTIKAFNDQGVPIRFTYTNSVLEEHHLEDKQCNFITECANNGMNEILVNSPLLEDYLREKYPNFKYISSTTKCIRDINKLNELINDDKYYLVLGDSRDNFDFDFLDKIQNKDKLEILIDPWCDINCKIKEDHYRALSQVQLGIQEDKDFEEEYFKCKWQTSSWQENYNSDHIIKVEDLQKYIDMGFKHFKLEGRSIHPMNVIDSYVYYLIKPEYQDEIRNLLVRVQYPKL